MTEPSSRRAGVVEFELLCLLVRPKAELVRAQGILAGGVDVQILLDLADEHGVRPQLRRRLSEISWSGVPDVVRSSLEGFCQFNGARALSLSEELGHVAVALAARGVPFAAFKGPALAAGLYGDLSLREYNDLDVIVPQERIGDAEAVLGALGFCATQGDRAFRQAFLAYQRQFTFRHPDIDAVIDLHWDFCGIHVPFPLAPAEVWADPAQVRVGNRTIPTVAGANLALLLAGHGTKEAWRCLEWVNDFALLIDSERSLDWAAIHRRAAARGCGDAVLLACAMAERLLAVPVPRDLVQPVAASARVAALAARLVAQMRDGLPGPDRKDDLSDVDLCDGRWDRMKAVLTLVLTRTVGDYHAMPLPRPLWRLYHLSRPFRLVAKALAARV